METVLIPPKKPLVSKTALCHLNRSLVNLFFFYNKATNVKGSVKWFHRVKGFGFITRDDTKEDVFVHYTSLKPVSIQFTRSKNRLNLMDKEKVLFDVVKSKPFESFDK